MARNIQRPEDPIPQGEQKAKVGIKVFGVGTVMNLVLGWAYEYLAEKWAIGKTTMGVSEMKSEKVEEKEKYADLTHGKQRPRSWNPPLNQTCGYS